MEQTKTLERQNSIKISINAKRQYSGEVKVYAETIEEAMKLCLEKAKEMEIIIQEKNAMI
jgi:hypothetical protein